MTRIADPALINKLRRWAQHPLILAKGWAPVLFWQPDEAGTPYGRLKVDACELEVLFATLLGEASACQATLDATANGRGTFIAANARRHELPLLSRARPEQASARP